MDSQKSDLSGLNTRFRRKGKQLATGAELSSNRRQALVVHPSPEMLEMIAAMFRNYGYHVTTAGESTRALLHSGRKRFDLMFCDLDMPLIDGYHLAGLIKRHHPDTKVVVMTCCCQAELVDLMVDGTIDGWLFKPFRLEMISDVLIEIGLKPGRCAHVANISEYRGDVLCPTSGEPDGQKLSS